MSAKRLNIWIYMCVFWLLLYGACYAYFAYCESTVAEILETLLPVALGIPAVVLAAGFSRRNSYLQALRDLWQSLIPAVQSAIQYTHLTPPTRSDFVQTQTALSSAIDELRGVFKNVPQRGGAVGLYPYEDLKDIVKAISWLGYETNFRTAQAVETRRCITRAWQNMHHAMLGEFDRDVPINPVSKYLEGESSEIDDLIDGSVHDNDIEQ